MISLINLFEFDMKNIHSFHKQLEDKHNSIMNHPHMEKASYHLASIDPYEAVSHLPPGLSNAVLAGRISIKTAHHILKSLREEEKEEQRK